MREGDASVREDASGHCVAWEGGRWWLERRARYVGPKRATAVRTQKCLAALPAVARQAAAEPGAHQAGSCGKEGGSDYI